MTPVGLDVDLDTVFSQADCTTRTGPGDAQQQCIIRRHPGWIHLDNLIGVKNEKAWCRGHTFAGTHAFILIDNNLIT